MYRYKFVIEYDASASEVGWQSQPNKISIQSILSDAASKLANTKILFYGASRTDRGVHAYHQVAHADFPKSYPLINLKRGMNFYLSNQKVCIRQVEFVSQDFHARFSAKIKTYRYDICIRDYPSVLHMRNWRIRKQLNIDDMKFASDFLLGEHDFASFRDSNCQAVSSIRSIDDIYFKISDDEISIYFIGKSFLHHQVRIMVGTLVDVGLGRKDKNINLIIEAKLREKAGPTAPPQGLFLEKIDFE